MPPRHGKSQLCSEYFPAWYLGTHPEDRILLASYGATFARSWGRKSRDVLSAYGPSLFGVSVRDDSSAADEWNLYKHLGGMSTAGVGTGTTGKGAKIFLIDDPHKDWQEAQSALIRERIADWFNSVAYTRLTADGAIIIVCTRWHYDDLPGRVIEQSRKGEGPEWHMINLPAIAETDDAVGRAEGEALWPEGGFTEQRLADIKRDVGLKVWTPLYQQRPQKASGSTFRLEHFSKRYRAKPKRYQAIYQAIDSAFKEGVGTDWSVIATWGIAENAYHVLRVWRKQVEFPELLQAVKDEAALMKPNAIFFEDRASGISAIQSLKRNTRLPIIPVEATDSKESRADAVSPDFDAGLVLLPDLEEYPEAAEWVTYFIEEHIAFPNFGHDDVVDTSTMILKKIKQSGVYYIKDPFDAPEDGTQTIDLTTFSLEEVAGW